MAARLNTRQADSTRSKIKSRRVIEELQRYFDGEREMTMGQLRAAQILLDKSMPSLKASEVTQVQDVQIQLVSYDNHPALVIEHESSDTVQ
tara:strand:- start:1261 stop:1533 length:273 start_codon:yes stop_codon:yes gene_type:complete